MYSLLTILELKRTPIIFGNLIWKPFDIRFHDLLEDMDHHREIVKTQLLIMIRDAQIEFAGKVERGSHLAAAEHHFAKTDTQKSKEMKAYMEKSLNHTEETKGLLEKQYQGQSLYLRFYLPYISSILSIDLHTLRALVLSYPKLAFASSVCSAA